MAVGTPAPRPGGRSLLQRSPAGRREDPRFRGLLKGMPGLVLALIVLFSGKFSQPPC
jgi:hypothetical protein